MPKNQKIYVLLGNAAPAAIYLKKASAEKKMAEMMKAKKPGNPDVAWTVKEFFLRTD